MSSAELDAGRRDGVSSPLISAHELSGLLDRPEVKVFDVRGKWGSPALHDEYLAGHVPGAVFLDWTKNFVEQDVSISLASVAQAEEAQQSFQELGIDSGDLVVLYDDYHHMLAGRMWWAMRYWGFENVRVLNGGWSHWVAQGLSVAEGGAESTSSGSFQVAAQDDTWRIGVEDFVDQKHSACVFDARGEKGYAGNPEDPRTGHIPGAINIPYNKVLNSNTGLFLEAGAIEEVLDAATPTWRERPVISSCGSGYAGTVLLLALQEVGMPAQLFDGSFSVWKQDPSREVSQS